MARIRVYIVRHGETAENRNGILQGHLDTELNDEGYRQAELVADALKDVSFKVAFSSDLKRAKMTAERILKNKPEVRLQTSEALRERFMGVFQGTKITKDTKVALSQDKTIESNQHLRERGVNWWKQTIIPMVSEADDSDTISVLMVSHGGFISSLIQELMEEGYATSDRYALPLGKCLNTAIAILELGGTDGTASLVNYGDISHLLNAKTQAKGVVQENVDEVEVDTSPSGSDSKGVVQTWLDSSSHDAR
ncbi:hypothetical protein CC1G_01211 [Coprinopsis cinerea okayama7|uniref:Phosphoglycerate mutase n=1 Tax=Coprinopsis cinerea (strain Okayama-7 / 130 / ATCC MYA-4618 / FGSC 9003) TaxID=240176 RepID=A8NEW8_COPC7|nr:hypothetical protein CC1G_01211 [Coprinopsis cinerea okayama7\|eukprot:XP_001833149.2 hypothetical protein CC1G_01211 [Coprinopsis cinerea okayama7\